MASEPRSLVSEIRVDEAPDRRPACYALLGNPNTGKTTLFNRLCGIRAKTANFPGSTVEARIGVTTIGSRKVHLIDLPGLYGLNLERPESRICKQYLAGDVTLGPRPDAVIIIADATNLARNLLLVSQALQQGLPAVVVLNMVDLAERRGLTIDVERLRERLECPVIAICARGTGHIPGLATVLEQPLKTTATLPSPTDAREASDWADEVVRACVTQRSDVATGRWDDRFDAVLTHPVLGLLIFVAIMTGLFYAIFALAPVPMDLIELVFTHVGGWLGSLLPEGAVRDLVVDGVVGGIAGTVVFLPQICLLFFLVSLLEDTGYLARAVFVVDRVLRRFGLPGQSFVPLLSAHACAIPAILSARLIPDRRERLATLLVAPFMSCSARLPVYVLLVGILFADRPLHAGIAFTGCYVLGAAAALFTALLARRTVLRGPARPMVMELPTYKWPSLRNAVLTTLDRALTFLRKAGTVILAICVVLWWLSAYPTADEPPDATALRAEATHLVATAPERAAQLDAEASVIATRHAMANSFAGRIGRTAAPVFRPIGLDWQLTVGVITSFAAREVFVSTLAVLFAGSDETDDVSVLERIKTATRDDGRPVLTASTAAGLLVFYVLAMQCLPTLVVTAREAGHWGWALLQFGYMSSLAYVLAALVYAGFAVWGHG